MVSFSKNNLLVFIGQRPDAHYILMDQNQLSAYVQQDAFPLFTHISNDFSSEFCELLRKVLTNRVSFDHTFVDGFYAETSGHPFLTVKVAILFLNKLHLIGDDFNSFAKHKLVAKSIALASEYDFFKHAISEALGPNGKKSTPWLHSVYSVIKQIAIDNPKTYRCSYEDYAETVNRLGLKDELGYTAEHLLTTGVSSNFLSHNNKMVGPKIKILAKIASISTPKITW
jgi:hypothetical protein